MAKGAKPEKGTPKAVEKTEEQTIEEKRLIAGKLLAKLWRARDEEVELDDTEQPKYVQPGPVSKDKIAKNKKLRQQAEKSETIKFLLKSEEMSRKQQEAAAQRYSQPFQKSDQALWKKLPPVPGPFGIGTLVRRGLAGEDDKAAGVFLDFFRNFQFGLWGYQQRPYPPQKPFDIQQVLGTKNLERRYYDMTMRTGGPWYYKDRLGRTRGPCQVLNLKTAWAAGIIDKNTFVWGEDMDEFAPIGMVYGLQRAIATPDAQLAAATTALSYRLGTFKSPFKPLKGHEEKSLQQLQEEALKEKEREKNIMRNAGGFWPGFKAPSHAVFLWASGSELTKTLDQGTKRFPDKFIPYETRKKLAKVIPGLRPWEVLEVEQVFNYLTFRDEFWRDPLGTYTTPLSYRDDLKESEAEEWGEIKDSLGQVFPEIDR